MKLSELLTGDPKDWPKVMTRRSMGDLFVVQFLGQCPDQQWVGYAITKGFEISIGNPVIENNEADDWQLYEEPKPKVVKWLWALPGVYQKGGLDLYSVFMTDDEAKQVTHVDREGTERPLIKLEWSRTEFDI